MREFCAENVKFMVKNLCVGIHAAQRQMEALSLIQIITFLRINHKNRHIKKNSYHRKTTGIQTQKNQYSNLFPIPSSHTTCLSPPAGIRRVREVARAEQSRCHLHQDRRKRDFSPPNT